MITIVAPYDRGEVTAAAVRLGELIITLGEHVRLVAEGPCQQLVHPYWDTRVISSTGNNFFKGVRGSQVIVWFVASDHLRKKADLVAEKARHIFVPTTHSLGRVDADWLADHHSDIVCPTLTMANFIKQRLYPKKQAPVTWARWSSGLDPVYRIGLCNQQHPRLLVHCDHSVVDGMDHVLFSSLNALMAARTSVQVTIVSLKSWETKGRRRLRQLTDRYGSRVQVQQPTSETDHFPLFHQNDWGLFPSPRADFGMYIQHARACGLTAMAFNIPPFDELILNGTNGVLLDCHTVSNWLGLPQAVPQIEVLSKQLIELVPDQGRLEAIQKAEWGLNELRSSFGGYWSRLLGTHDAD